MQQLIKCLVMVTYLILLKSDGIIFSKPIVWSHFDSTQSYPYIAAELGHPQANLALFQHSQNLDYLKRAANLGLAGAAFQLFELAKEQNDTVESQLWLNHASILGSINARLELLKLHVLRKNWQQAQEFYLQHLADWPTLTADNLKQVNQLQVQTEFALSTDEDLLKAKVDVSAPILSNAVNERLQGAIPQCDITADVLVENMSLLKSTQRLLGQYQKEHNAQQLVCFSNVYVASSISSLCDEDPEGRIDCDLKKLSLVYKSIVTKEKPKRPSSHLLVVVESGDANTRGGLMFLDRLDNVAVLKHEIAHWLQLYDEYQIHPSQQTLLCHTYNHKTLGKNLVVATKDTEVTELESIYQRALYPAKTCNNTKYKAYKFFSEPSFMEFLDLPISSQYWELMTGKSGQAITPAAMNFALAFKADDTALTDKKIKQLQKAEQVYWLTQASNLNFLPAKRMLAQHYFQNGDFKAGFELLDVAAQGGDPTSQVLLGHYYIESTWLPQDLKTSAHWYKQAAIQDDTYGLYFYGKCLENGWGCIQDIEKAFEYYARAAKLGSKLALKRLGH